VTARFHSAPITDAATFAAHFDVSRETLERLETYAALLRQWQPTINLVAPSTIPNLWERHFADSAQLLALAPPNATTWLDLGSGAGFPGLVLAILLAGRGGTKAAKVTLIESDSRKAAFLAEVARKTGVPVDILCKRIETATTQAKLPAFDVVTARALAPLPRLMSLAAPYFSPATTGVFPKGREAGAEIEAAREGFEFDVAQHPSLTDAHGRILVVTGLKAKTEDRSR
jgi:16S rRNA (guanine527-N7)-methyltransferase